MAKPNDLVGPLSVFAIVAVAFFAWSSSDNAKASGQPQPAVNVAGYQPPPVRSFKFDNPEGETFYINSWEEKGIRCYVVSPKNRSHAGPITTSCVKL